MSKVFLITHPETDLDKQGRVHGRLDPPLSYSGRIRAKQIAESLKSKDVVRIHSSPRARAKETAELIAKATGAPISYHKDLEPWDLGSMSGVKTKSMQPLLEFFSSRPYKAVPGGESKSAVLARYKSFMRKVKDGDVIVGHSQHSLALDHVQKGGDASKVPMFGGKAGEIRTISL